jgi:hypothetical protein
MGSGRRGRCSQAHAAPVWSYSRTTTVKQIVSGVGMKYYLIPLCRYNENKCPPLYPGLVSI